MYRITMLLAAGMLTMQANAQSGFYLAPSIGAGMSGVKQNYFSIDHKNGFSPDSKAIFSYNARLGVGYNYKKWRLETGLQYSVTGYKIEMIFLGIDFPSGPAGTTETRYQHLSVPLRLGYSIRLSDRLHFVPYAGILASYNMGARTITEIPGSLKSDYRWKSKDFKNQFNSIAVWGNLALQLEYKTSDRISIFGGPSAQYMISNFLKTPDNALYKASDRQYSVHIDLGVKIGLTRS
jgi:hypothetical protein